MKGFLQVCNMRSRKLYILFLPFFILFACNNQKQNAEQQVETQVQESIRPGKALSGKVVGISDGDTFKLLVDGNKTIRVRLFGIDAPEKEQDYGTQAKQALSNLIFAKEVQVEQKNKDRYGRIIGVVYVNNINVNEELLRQGMVWHYTEFDKSERWAELSKEARQGKMGLWNKRNPTPPWQWRKGKRQQQVAE